MKIKAKVFLGVFLVLLTLMLSVISVSAAPEALDEMDMARQSGQSYISEPAEPFPEWRGATLASGEEYQNLEGQPVAYMFAIQNGDKVIGRIVVGSKAYDYDVFEAGSASLPQIPDFAELRAVVAKDLDTHIDRMTIGEPRLVYLGYESYLAVYDINGEAIAFDLRARRVALLRDFKSSLISSQQYQAIKAEIRTRAVIEQTFLPVPLQGQYNSAVPEELRSTGCGPASGAMVAEYYKEERSYSRFYDWADDFEYLYDSMGTGGMGTMPWNAGPGFVNYAEHAPVSYDFDSDYTGISINYHTYYYNQLKSFINDSQPLMVLFNGDAPYADWHYCAISGFRVKDDPLREMYINDPGGQYGHKEFVSYDANWPYIILVWLWPE